VTALVKATEVAVATGPVEGLSIRNRLAGTVVGVVAGEAMATVRIAVADVGVELTAAITRDAVADLGIGEGTSVVALIKATDVALSTLPV
jgi:molybdate transport system regulatory protein